MCRGKGRISRRPHKLCKRCGADSNGTVLLKALRELGVDTSNVKVLASDVNTDDTYDMTSTASYCAVHGQDGNLIVACADFTILDSFTAEDVEALCNSSKGVLDGIVVLDGNFSASVFAKIAHLVAARKLQNRSNSCLPLLF